MKRGQKVFWAAGTILAALLMTFLVLANTKPRGFTDHLQWGVAFSRPWASELGLDWRAAYLTMLDELHPPSIRLPIYWTDVEREQGAYSFSDYDWMITEAGARGISIIPVVGRKIPRWPECHIPAWAAGLTDSELKENILNLISQVVLHYQDRKNISAWQVENEPFLPFGECSPLGASFLDAEIDLVHSLDVERPVVVTDSGELGMWFRAASRADIFGTTMYRIVWNRITGHLRYPLPPKFFWLKANLVRLFYPDRPIMVSELQAEPWGPGVTYDLPIAEQMKSMSIEQFRDNINYARAVGFSPAYLWGAEWWYWMKEKQHHPEFWEEARRLFGQL